MSDRKVRFQNDVVIMRALIAVLRQQGGRGGDVHIRALEQQITDTLDHWGHEAGEELLP